jgi:hypothetical protein
MPCSPASNRLHLLSAPGHGGSAGRHRLQVAVEFRDHLITAFLFFLFALSLELDEVLGSSLGPCRSHQAILATNIMLSEADVEPREKEGGRLRNRDEKEGK